jgi:hypothetical protein
LRTSGTSGTLGQVLQVLNNAGFDMLDTADLCRL